MPNNSYNSDNLYKKYDELKKVKFNEDYILYQPCYEENLKSQYSLKAMIEINSWFSTNEFIEIPIDFYADDNLKDKNKIQEDKTTEEDELPSLEDIIKDNNSKIKKIKKLKKIMKIKMKLLIMDIIILIKYVDNNIK